MGLAALAIAACVALGAWLAPRGSGGEMGHANWKYVDQATRHSRTTSQPHAALVGASGAVRLVTSLQLDEKQRDTTTTAKVVERLKSGKSEEAQQAVIATQQIPDVKLAADQTALEAKLDPTVIEGMKEEILRGDSQFFHLFLFDSCDEDGDVVEIELNGRSFATVPLTHAGATLSIPLAAGKTTSLGLRGIRDGQGGITVAMQTSEGQGFLGRMQEGEFVSLGLVGR